MDSLALFTPSDTVVIIDEICFVADADLTARALTSSATTANPFPYSPARAASIAALSARRLV